MIAPRIAFGTILLPSYFSGTGPGLLNTGTCLASLLPPQSQRQRIGHRVQACRTVRLLCRAIEAVFISRHETNDGDARAARWR